MKRIKHISILLALIMLSTVMLPAAIQAATVSVLIGDVNLDGVVNTGDATFILKHCAGMKLITDPVAFIAADVNRDGQVNTGDASAVLRGIAGSIEFEIIETDVPSTSEQPTAPITDEPTAPVTEEPTAPVTDEPTAPVTDEPTTPVTEEPTTPVTEEPTEPSGSLIIRTVEDFENIPITGMDKTYELANDIDFGGAVVSPLGKSNNMVFTGTFIGNGHTLSNFTFGRASKEGLFYENAGTITGLNAVIADTVAVSEFGIIAFTNKTNGTIQKCGVSGNFNIASGGNYWYIGGVAAHNNGTIEQCWSNVNITAAHSTQYYHGGIAGYSDGTVLNSFAFGTIQSPRGAGIVGYLDGRIENCYSMCKVNDTDPEGYSNWTKHAWAEVGDRFEMKGFFYQKGLYYKNGVLGTNWDEYSDPNGYYGCRLKTDEWLEETFTASGWSTDVWDFTGEYPTLKNAPILGTIEAMPPVTPIYEEE